MTMEYAYYPGCTSCSTGLAFEMSSQYMARAIGLDLKEIPDWNCCGASAAHLINHDLSIALPARTLAISQDELPGLDIVAPCAACFARLKNTRHYVKESKEHRTHIEDLIEREYRGEENVYSLLQVCAENEDIKEAIQAHTKKSLNGLKVACYYGCVLVRPKEIAEFDDDENPQSMDNVMKLVGAEPVDWAFKTECCGASLQVTVPSAGKVMVEKILHDAKENGAEAIVTACPLCQLNLDMRQKEVNTMAGTDYDLPVYYFTELVSLCLGATPQDVGVDKHYWPAVEPAEKAMQPPVVSAAPEETATSVKTKASTANGSAQKAAEPAQDATTSATETAEGSAAKTAAASVAETAESSDSSDATKKDEVVAP